MKTYNLKDDDELILTGKQIKELKKKTLQKFSKELIDFCESKRLPCWETFGSSGETMHNNGAYYTVIEKIREMLK
jgi:hypothetical protein